MRFEVRHETRYTYSRPVFLEPHTIRLRPRADGSVLLKAFELHIDPEPVGRSDCLDAEGNAVVSAWFEDLADTLTIKTAFGVQTLRINAFDYLLEPGAGRLPLALDDRSAAVLAAYRTRQAGPAGDPVRRLAEQVAQESGGQTTAFLGGLNRRLHEACRVVIRPEGATWPAHETLSRGEGACRDLAALFVDACRALGVAARFVSGYQAGDPDQDQRHLHAWAEVYLPGGGWRGYDPTLGLKVADQHVPVAAAARPDDAAPVTGSLRGTGAVAQLQTQIHIHRAGASEHEPRALGQAN